jgi:hypothetical protein
VPQLNIRQHTKLKYPLRETAIAAEQEVIRLDNAIHGILKKLRREVKNAEREDTRDITQNPQRSNERRKTKLQKINDYMIVMFLKPGIRQ